jgi:hypothetical protein
MLGERERGRGGGAKRSCGARAFGALAVGSGEEGGANVFSCEVSFF